MYCTAGAVVEVYGWGMVGYGWLMVGMVLLHGMHLSTHQIESTPTLSAPLPLPYMYTVRKFV